VARKFAQRHFAITDYSVAGRVERVDVLEFDLRNNGVGVGKISPKVPQEYVGRMNDLRQQIIAGKVKVPAEIAK
jgi:hypothetical protein